MDAVNTLAALPSVQQIMPQTAAHRRTMLA
jgi:hypothetical protein